MKGRSLSTSTSKNRIIADRQLRGLIESEPARTAAWKTRTIKVQGVSLAK
jgi:hypothetical protein